MYLILPINRESLRLIHVNLAWVIPSPVTIWSCEFVEALIQAGKEETRKQRAIKVNLEK